MQKFAPDELIRRIDEVLFYIWDPIGVSTNPSARREYSKYAEKILTMLKNGKGADSVKKYLNDLESGMLGSSANEQRVNKTAELIVLHKEAIDEGHA